MMMIMMMCLLPSGWAAFGVTAGETRRSEDSGTTTDYKKRAAGRLRCPAQWVTIKSREAGVAGVGEFSERIFVGFFGLNKYFQAFTHFYKNITYLSCPLRHLVFNVLSNDFFIFSNLRYLELRSSRSPMSQKSSHWVKAFRSKERNL